MMEFVELTLILEMKRIFFIFFIFNLRNMRVEKETDALGIAMVLQAVKTQERERERISASLRVQTSAAPFFFIGA